MGNSTNKYQIDVVKPHITKITSAIRPEPIKIIAAECIQLIDNNKLTISKLKNLVRMLREHYDKLYITYITYNAKQENITAHIEEISLKNKELNARNRLYLPAEILLLSSAGIIALAGILTCTVGVSLFFISLSAVAPIPLATTLLYVGGMILIDIAVVLTVTLLIPTVIEFFYNYKTENLRPLTRELNDLKVSLNALAHERDSLPTWNLSDTNDLLNYVKECTSIISELEKDIEFLEDNTLSAAHLLEKQGIFTGDKDETKKLYPVIDNITPGKK